MPICTICTHKIPYLYTVYESAYNLRLEQCPNCLNFADPYVEHDTLTLLLDLILLKRDVFRHLLHNRGYPPRYATNSSEDDSQLDPDEQSVQKQREKERWKQIAQLGICLIFVDAFIRWSHLGQKSSSGDSIWMRDGAEPLLRIFAGCIIETTAFHAGIVLTSIIVLKGMNAWSARRTQVSNVRDGLRISHVSLTLLYSSLTKLFLLLMLALWKPSSLPSPHAFLLRNGTNEGMLSSFISHDLTQRALQMLDDDKLDREWIVRNVLGGLSAGFGLRVVLDVPPVFTTLIILTGWILKTTVANFVSSWVNKGDSSGDVFLAYSIP